VQVGSISGMFPMRYLGFGKKENPVQTGVTIQTKQDVEMGSTYKTILRIARRAIGTLQLIRIQRIGIEEVVLAKVLSFTSRKLSQTGEVGSCNRAGTGH